MPLKIYSQSVFGFSKTQHFNLAADYSKALNLFWQGKTSEVVDYISDVVAENPECESVFQFYRLWIEQLSVLGEMDSLMKLKKHLVVRGYENSAHVATWQALRGLVHLELDEFQAVKLICRSIEDFIENPYCMELLQKKNFRDTPAQKFEQPLLQSKVGVSDYFHWQTIAQGLLLNENQKELTQVLSHIHGLFPDSPMQDLYVIHQNISNNNAHELIDAGSSLVEKFPDNVDYRVVSAYLKYQDQDYEGCINELSGLKEDINDVDADIQILKGYSHFHISNEDPDSVNFKKAEGYLTRAKKALTSTGIESPELSRQLQKMEELSAKFSNTIALEDLRPIQAWLIKLDQTQYYEMANAKERDLEYLSWSMGKEAYPGDLVFFASEDPYGKTDTWRIVSIFNISSKPNWHPMNRYQNTMDLVYRPTRPVEIDIQISDEDVDVTSESLSYEDPFHYGVFGLEAGAIDIITEAVKQRNDENDNKIFEVLSSLKLTS